jgi:CDP-glycerol glycerophosphotransferase
MNKLHAFLRKYMPLWVKLVMFYVYTISMSVIYSGFMLFPVKHNKICFLCHHGGGYGDSVKYIHQALTIKRKNLDCVWFVTNIRQTASIPSLRYVKLNTLKMMYEAATAEMWIFNTRSELWMRKRKGQFYIQTWHGGLGIKSTEADLGNKIFPGYLRAAKADSKKADLFISNSKYGTNKYRKAFWYNGEILECGFPRNDIFYSQQTTEKRLRLLSSLGIKEDIKLAIYAPTFRKSHTTEQMNLDISNLLRSLTERFGGAWHLLIRLHPLDINLGLSLNQKNQDCTDIGAISDVYDILPFCDTLISDYSSIMFDYMMTGKPVFIYAPDILEYMRERDFTFPLDSLPFPVAESNTELQNSILRYDAPKYKNNVSTFLETQPIYDTGRATEIITERIIYELKRDKD